MRVSARDGQVGLFPARWAAGVTWRLVIASAPWAGRAGHTSVIDAAGAIYVIGGTGSSSAGTIYFKDVWISTDGGADRTWVVLGGTAGTRGYSWGTGCTKGVKGALKGHSRVV